jgi:hypothetical protein
MSNKSKAKPVDRAEPTIKQATGTDAQKVNVARSTTASMAKGPLWAGAPDVQTAAKGWNQAADDLDGNAKVVADLKNQLSAAEAKQRTLRRNWRACKRQVLSTVSLVCAGSADNVKGFSLEVITRSTASSLAAVDGITTSPGAVVGSVTARWPRGLARNGFVVQHASSVADATTYSPPIPCTRVKYTLTGASPSGSIVYLRVAAVDPLAPSGQSPWSAWVAGTVG